MALDAVFLSAVAKQLREQLLGAKLDKIYQNEKDELTIVFRTRNGARRLVLSAAANHPRAQITAQRTPNPAVAPNFCMLLRKHFGVSTLTSITQPPFERVLDFTFACLSELGDRVDKHIIIEIMGKHANIIVTDENGVIIDAIKRVGYDMSSVRAVLPGLSYTPPPGQDKILPDQLDARRFAGEVLAAQPEREIPALLIQHLMGVSPIICREIAYRALGSVHKSYGELSGSERERLVFQLGRFQEMILSASFTPVLVRDADSRRPRDIAFCEIHQYGAKAICEKLSDFCTLLDAFYADRERTDRMAQRSADLLKTLTHLCERIARRTDNQRAELAACKDRDKYRIYGELLTANLHRIEKGASAVRVPNFYAQDNEPLTIPLDVARSPAQNAQRYFKRYQKAKSAESILGEQIRRGEQELRYVESIFDSLSRAEDENDLNQIRQEMADAGYITIKRTKQSNMGRDTRAKFMSFVSDEGFSILAGKNNLQNDALTFKTAAKQDMWLHARNIPGSHVVIQSEKKAIPNAVLEQAAVIAATLSQAGKSAKVAVDYTLAKYVRKQQGGSPGQVIYTDFATAIVDPDETLLERLRVKKK